MLAAPSARTVLLTYGPSKWPRSSSTSSSESRNAKCSVLNFLSSSSRTGTSNAISNGNRIPSTEFYTTHSSASNPT